MLAVTEFSSLTEPVGRRRELTLDELGGLLTEHARRPHDGTGWSPGTYAGNRRGKDHVKGVTMLGLDLDGGEATTEQLAAFLEGFEGFIHTTKSHTPEHPRYRILIPLDRPVTADEYGVLWEHMAAELADAGIVADQGAKDASRFWFWPSRPATGFPLVQRLEGEPLGVDAVLAAAKLPEPEPPPREPSTRKRAGDRYAEAALDRAGDELHAAPKGERNTTLAREAYTIGQLVGARLLNEHVALTELERAIAGWDPRAMRLHRRTLERQFREGKKKPRAPEPRPESREAEAAPPPAAEAEETTVVGRAWQPLASGLLSVQPPPRNWVLRHPTRDGHPCAPCAGDGLLPRGKAGLLVADGGIGKTNALIALAVSVLTARPWFGHFHVEPAASRGRVLLVLAEEDPEEVHRRLYNVADAYELDADERRHVERELIVLPLAGEVVHLVVPGRGGRDLVDSPELATIRRLLARDAGENGWALVAIDPYTRVAPEEAETDNAIATRTMQAAESLVSAPGSPSVLLAHHVSSAALQTGALRSRGVTGIRNAARWEGTLRAEAGDVFFRQSKSNYSRPMDDELLLVRGPGGLLRVPGSEETAAREARAEERAVDVATERDRLKDERYRARLAAWANRLVDVATAEPKSAKELAALAGVGRNDAPSGIAIAVADGRLVAGWPIKGFVRYARAPRAPSDARAPRAPSGT